MLAGRVFSEMDRLLDALGRLMKTRQIARWLKEPNRAFAGSSPAQLIQRPPKRSPVANALLRGIRIGETVPISSLRTAEETGRSLLLLVFRLE